MILAILNAAQQIAIWLQSLLQTRQHILTLGLAVNHQHKGLTAVLMHATAILLDKVHDRLNVKFLEGALLIERLGTRVRNIQLAIDIPQISLHAVEAPIEGVKQRARVLIIVVREGVVIDLSALRLRGQSHQQQQDK